LIQYTTYMAEVKLEAHWKEVLKEEFDKPYFLALRTTLVEAKAAGKVIYPPGGLIFNAFEQTPFPAVKVVILGQDPYHNPGEAMGLSFSVPKGVPVPPSLKNIYKELHRGTGTPIPAHGDLTGWAKQGVLLLNAMLTVEKNQPGSHRDIGWQSFTDAVIQAISREKNGVVFLLWGNFAKSKKNLIDSQRHFVLEAAHPSPLARNAFWGCGHFEKTNQLLTQQGVDPIDWAL
jgi:uracil-DNA glycosylase